MGSENLSLSTGVTLRSVPLDVLLEELRVRLGFGEPKVLEPPREFAARLSICERTLWDLTQQGQIPHVKIGRLTRYDVRDAWRFADAKKIGGVEHA